MPPPFAPHKRMLMSIPVGCSLFHRLFDFFPRLEATPFEGQRTQDLPPGFNQVQVGRIGRLIDKLPALMREHEEQQIVAMVHLQIIHDGVDALDLGWNLLIDKTEKIEEVLFRSLWITLRPAVSCCLPKGPIHVTHVSTPIVDFLLGPHSWPLRDIDGLLPRIALGTDW